ncbi:MAG: GGDEF domain-containing protein [Piscinibacter sp.]|uniref:GGDEF domain-containing protein n=1 Tax=Piscinibacter sp. TaxID=1903157 RepID=UPI003D1449C9
MASDLTILLLAQFALYGLGWLLLGALLRELRVPAWLWAAYSVMQATGMFVAAASDGSGPLPPPEALFVSLAGYASASLGVDLYLHGRLRFKTVWVVLAGGGLLLQVALHLSGAPAIARAVGFNAAIAALLLISQALFYTPMRREFGRLGLLAQLPGLVFGAFVLLRCVVLLMDPSRLESSRGFMAELPIVLPALLAGGLFHFTFAGLVISRFVGRLRHVARHDALTGLLNRGTMEEALNAEWLRYLRQRTPLSVAFVDVDHFKRINDTGGHESGDQVLRQIAALLGRHARGTDRVARWGGEEFLLLMPHTDAAGAQTALQRLQGELRDTQPSLPPGCGTLTFSIGVATTSASDLSVDVLVARADAAMYAAKQAGRNRIVAAG